VSTAKRRSRERGACLAGWAGWEALGLGSEGVGIPGSVDGVVMMVDK
jgi:hypothetical protein